METNGLKFKAAPNLYKQGQWVVSIGEAICADFVDVYNAYGKCLFSAEDQAKRFCVAMNTPSHEH